MRIAADVKAEIDTELEMMKGIVAMLLSCARLAELVSRAPRPVRSFVLWLLRRAETVVREWVDGPEDFWPNAIRVGKDRADALDLAASFRALARAVRQMAAEYRRSTRRWRHDDVGKADGAQQHAVARLHHPGAARELLSRLNLALTPFPDTS